MKLHNWIPNQHGAWAMLITPLALTGFQDRWSLELLGLIIGWLFGYATSFYFGLTIKGWRNETKRKKYVWQITSYILLGVVFALPALLQQPRLLYFAPIAMFALAANLYFIHIRDERNWINDVVGILVSFALAYLYLETSNFAALEFLLWPFLYFLGTVFYVKTMIRERGNRAWYKFSIAYHLGIALIASLLAPLVAFGYLLILVRAVVLPNRVLRPAVIGIIEIWLTIVISVLSLMC